MQPRSALGKGLGSLIPEKKTITEQVIPEARQEVLDLALDTIRENPHQPRHHFAEKELDDLMSSIKQHGVLQPLVVTKGADGYQLIAGERRLRASRKLGLKTVPAIVREADEQQQLELALIENVQRQDLNAVEEALAFKALVDEFNLTQQQVATQVGKSRSAVANTLRLLDLPDEMLRALREGTISKSHARTLLAEPDANKREALFKQMCTGGFTVRAAETAVQKHASTPSGGGAKKDPNILDHEKRLREVLGTRVDIREQDGKGKISIAFYSKEELMDLLDRLSE